MWIKKSADVEVSKELEFENQNIDKTDAYEVTITEAYLKESSDEQSKSMSLVINAETKDGDNVKTYFTVTGRDGETYFKTTHKGKEVKKQHFGLSIANSVFLMLLKQEIFDIEPAKTSFKQWNKENKEMESCTGDGFPELIGKKVGVCVQMIKKINGKDSSQYPEIAHFFDLATGLFAEEEPSNRRKLDRWLSSAKEYKVVEEKEVKSSFGKKPEEKKQNKWSKS